MNYNKGIAILFLLLCSQTVPAQNWTRWRGAGGQNHSTPIVVNEESRVTTQWTARVGAGSSTVLVRDAKVYTFGNKRIIQGADTTFQDEVACLDATSGTVLWRHRYPCPSKRWSGPNATPFLDGGRLYTLSRMGDLFCLNAGTGAIIWQRQLVDEGFSLVPAWGFAGSPIVEGAHLYLNAGQWGLALEKRTGSVKWKSPAEKAGHGSPVFFNYKDQRQMALMGKAMLYVVNPASGQVIWSREKNDETYTDPIIMGDVMLVTSFRPGCELLKLTDQGPKVVWESSTTKTSSWQTLTLKGHYGYAPHSQQRKQTFQCIDTRTGMLKWAEPLGDWGALTLAGDQLIMITGDGELIIAPATPEGFKPVFRERFVQLPPFKPGVSEEVIWTHPVWANGRIYVRTTKGQLFCLAVD